MYILGVGAAYPSQTLSDDSLRALPGVLSAESQSFLSRTGISSRRTSLPTEYVRTRGSEDVLLSRNIATDTPTTLGIRAVKQALEQANISIEQVGLLVADTATPYQTCPSEAQRIAGSFGIRLASYDITAGVRAIPFFLSLINSWKPERTPDYVVCVSTNTPTQHIPYATQDLTAYIFGDAASAVVLSHSHHGKLRVSQTKDLFTRLTSPSITVERTISLNPSRIPTKSELSQLVMQTIEGGGHDKRRIHIIGPQLLSYELQSIASELNLSAEQIIATSPEDGYSLGSSSGIALSLASDRAHAGNAILIIDGADGLWSTATVEVSG